MSDILEAQVPATNAAGADTVRHSNDDLHRAARKELHEADQIVFRLMPATISQIIEHKVWQSRARKFASFGEYALDQTSEGLGISNNRLLWLLRCSLDVNGAHVGEWASVLEEVEKAVKVHAANDGKKIRDFNGNSLETLGKACVGRHTETITYLPSRNRHLDGSLVRLQRAAPETFSRVVAGEIGVAQGVAEVRMRTLDQKRETAEKRKQRERRERRRLLAEERQKQRLEAERRERKEKSAKIKEAAHEASEVILDILEPEIMALLYKLRPVDHWDARDFDLELGAWLFERRPPPAGRPT